MKGSTFAEQNDVLGCGKNANCYDLPIQRVHWPKTSEELAHEMQLRAECKAEHPDMPLIDMDSNNHGVISFWVLDEGDIENIVKNCGVYFFCRGTTHPPISIHSENPCK